MSTHIWKHNQKIKKIGIILNSVMLLEAVSSRVFGGSVFHIGNWYIPDALQFAIEVFYLLCAFLIPVAAIYTLVLAIKFRSLDTINKWILFATFVVTYVLYLSIGSLFDFPIQTF